VPTLCNTTEKISTDSVLKGNKERDWGGGHTITYVFLR